MQQIHQVNKAPVVIISLDVVYETHAFFTFHNQVSVTVDQRDIGRIEHICSEGRLQGFSGPNAHSAHGSHPHTVLYHLNTPIQE